MADRPRARVLVSGHVQGVFYRATTRDAAREHDVDGWVKNLDDVSVTWESPGGIDGFSIER